MKATSARYPVSAEDQMKIYLVWGLKKQSRSGCHHSDSECKGSTVFDDDFDLNSDAAQQDLVVGTWFNLPHVRWRFKICCPSFIGLIANGPTWNSESVSQSYAILVGNSKNISVWKWPFPCVCTDMIHHKLRWSFMAWNLFNNSKNRFYHRKKRFYHGKTRFKVEKPV